MFDNSLMGSLRKKLAKSTLTARFYLTAGLLLMLTAVVFAAAGTRYVTEQTLLNAAKHASAQANELQAEYGDRLTPEKWRRLLMRWKENDFVAAKIWSPEGVIRYASEPALNGRRFPLDNDLKEAFGGELEFHLTKLEKEENLLERAHGELLEIYAPVKVNGEVVAVHELYLSAVPLRQEIARVSLLIWLSCLAAFALLYLLLSSLVARASKKISTQQESLESALSELSANYYATVTSFNLALQSRDNYTALHTERVADLAMKIAEELGFCADGLDALRIGALFHDIGKIGIPDEILLKPGPLTADEFQQVKRHPMIGNDIMAPLQPMAGALAVIRHHHERWDGHGYPDGLKGDAIDMSAQIASYADVYDALTSDRPYRRALTHEEALATMAKMVGSHFNPDLAPKVLDILAELARRKTGPGATEYPSRLPTAATGRA